MPADTPETAIEVDHVVPSTPENVSWGWYPTDKEPVLRVASGETVRIETLTHAGATQDEDPVSYLTGLGIPRRRSSRTSSRSGRIGTADPVRAGVATSSRARSGSRAPSRETCSRCRSSI